jgi:carboxyl-terminal processing protease
MRFTRRSILLSIVIAAICSVRFAVPAYCAEPDKKAEVNELLSQMRSREVGAWEASFRLEKLGSEIAPIVEEQLDSLSPEYKAAAARALCKIGDVPRAVKALAEIVEDQPNTPLGRDVAELLGEYGRSQAEGALVRLLDKAQRVDVKIALARSLWSAATTNEAWQKANTTLREVFAEAKGEDRKKCALALAEISDFSDEVLEVLEALRVEPGHRGGQARALLNLRSLRQTKRRDLANTGGFKDPVLNEIAQKLQKFHVDQPKPFAELRDSAAQGMASSLDPFTSYMDAKQYGEFRENMSGEYAGIGARVGFLGDVDDPDERTFNVIRPIYSGPAYRSGLRSYDQIVKINGEPAKGKELKDLVTELKGKPGTKVNVTILRHSLPGEKEITIERESIQLKSVYYRMLPASIGYVKLLHFGDGAVEELAAALEDLEGQGLEALIIDLRDNPGGLLSAAVDIADMFLKNDKLIVRSEGRLVPEERHVTNDPATHPDYPLVVLVNDKSASASEIVAGALQDYKRAVLVGQRTYGKGSVQRLMNIRSDGALKITIAKYYLPSGRSIQRTHTDRGGVKPDIELQQESHMDANDLGKFEDVRRAESFDIYTEKYLAEHKTLFEELAEFDEEDSSKYPGFDKWYEGLTVPMAKDSARYLLRAWIRIQLGDEHGAERVVDIQADDQLMRTIAEAAILLGKEKELEEIKQYKGLLKRFKLE